MVQNLLNESPDSVLDMKNMNLTYNNMINQSPPKNYKRYIKDLLEEIVKENRNSICSPTCYESIRKSLFISLTEGSCLEHVYQLMGSLY